MTRTQSSVRNLLAYTLGQCIITLTSFACRRVFLSCLGSEYLGLSGLFGHILSFLSLAEPGFMASVIYAYYRPIAENDTRKISALNSFLSGVNAFCTVIMVALAVCILPFIPRLVDIPKGLSKAPYIFVISVAELASGCLFSARRAFVFADRRGYITQIVHTVFFVLMSLSRIAVLILTKSYVAYALISLCFSVGEDLLLHFYLGRKYPFLRDSSQTLSHDELWSVSKRVGALFFHRLAGIVVGSADNLTIISLMGLSSGTLYSNYTMISGTLLSFVSIATGSISSSLGNLDASKGRESMKRIFRKALIVVLVGVTIITPMLFFAYPKIISAWVGDEYLLDCTDTLLFCLCFSVSAVRSVFLVFRDAMGLYSHELAKPFLELAVNLPLTLMLSQTLGIRGVLIGQLSGMLVCLVYEPIVVANALAKKKSLPCRSVCFTA